MLLQAHFEGRQGAAVELNPSQMSTIEVRIFPSKKSSPGSLSSRFRDAVELFSFPSKEGASERSKLLWLVKLRWAAIGLFLLLGAPTFVAGHLSRSAIPLFMGVLGLLIVFNLISQMVFAAPRRNLGPIVICFQLAFDLLLLSWILVISGGVESPFMMIFFLNVSLGGILIAGRLSWPFLVLAHTFLGALQFQVVVANQGHVDGAMLAQFVIFHLMAFGFWLVMRSLGASLEAQSERQSQAQVVLEKQDRLRSLGALAAGFSHEFASPLNVAKIRLERLRRQSGESEDLAEAMKAILTCENVIHQMNSSQFDSRDFQFKKVQVSELLTDVVESWQEDHLENRISLHLQDEIESFLPPLNFAQVILNLLDNASEAAPGGLIEIRLERTKNEIQLSFEDEGSGFPKEVLKQRGEPFVTTKQDGTGLGLYVSELFAQSLGGRLEITNRTGRGAKVTMSWPVYGAER